MTTPLFIKITLHDQGNVAQTLAPYVNTLPSVPGTSRLVVLEQEFGVLDTGLYIYNNQAWRYLMPIEAVSAVVIENQPVDVYVNQVQTTALGPNKVVYRNGQLSSVDTVDGNADYAVRTVASASGVISVNGKTGVVLLTATDIPGLATVATTGSYNDLTDKPAIPAAYVLPAATATVLGGVKIGAGLAVTADGTLSASAQPLTPATTAVLGGVIVGTGLTVQPDGTLSADAQPLAPATTTTLGGVIVGAGLTVAADGTLSAGTSVLPIATTTVLGGVKVGSGLAVTGDGTVSIVASGVVASTYRSVTVNAQGLVTAGTNPTTLAGYGITDALPTAGGTMTGDIVFTSGKISGLPAPSLPNDAANKAYVDGLIAGVANGVFWHDPVVAASTANVTTLSGLIALDGYTPAAGDRILLKDQTDPTQNGVYVAASGAWSRSADADTGAEIQHAAILVLNGSVNMLTQWVNTNNGTAPVIGTDPITFGKLNAQTPYTASGGVMLTGNNFTLANSGVTAGTYTKVTVNAQGQVTTGTQLLSADVVSALGYTPYNGATNPNNYLTASAAVITLQGDVTGSATLGNPIVTQLASSGVFVGTYTKVSVDAKGRVTSGGQISTAEILTSLGYTPVNKAGDSMGGALNFAGSVSVAAAATTNIGAAASNIVVVTGTAQINGFDSAPGAMRIVLFNSAGVVLANSANLVLPTGSNITTLAGDTALFVNTGGLGWRCWSYQRADGYALAGSVSPWLTLQDFQGSTTQLAARFSNVAEKVNVVAANATTVLTNSGAVTLCTVAPTANWTYNFRHSSAALLDAVMSVGDSVTVSVITIQGAAAFVPSVVQVDGATRTVFWQGGSAPSAGNANSRDTYTFTIIKTAANTFTVLGSQTQFK